LDLETFLESFGNTLGLPDTNKVLICLLGLGVVVLVWLYWGDLVLAS
jgi:ABC-type Mn2+/Zn2+ transport system permease subunit